MESTGEARTPGNGELDQTPRELAYRRVFSVRRSTQQFAARLTRTTAEVSDQAVMDRELAHAVRAMTLMIANVSLAQEVLDRLPMPAELLRPVE
jgi:hypothetical protein